ncbi:MAG: c-type cytochrome, partial [Novosphingobium sp.]
MIVFRPFRAAVLAIAGLLSGVALLGAAHAASEPAKDWTGRDPALEKLPGAAIYRENCASCHDAGVNRAPQRGNLGDMTPEAILGALTQGAMQPQGSALSEEQRTQVAEYISGRKLGASAAQTALNMCSGQAARFDMYEPPAFTGWGLDPENS